MKNNQLQIQDYLLLRLNFLQHIKNTCYLFSEEPAWGYQVSGKIGSGMSF